jgi:hypothetical protein
MVMKYVFALSFGKRHHPVAFDATRLAGSFHPGFLQLTRAPSPKRFRLFEGIAE